MINGYQGVDVSAGSGVVANAIATATLAASTSGLLTYISGFILYIGGATAGALVNATITGLKGGTRTFPVAVPTGATLENIVSITLPKPIPAAAVNAAIAVSVPAAGAGNTAVAVEAIGFQA